MNTLNINLDTLRQQREHLLSHVWHDSKNPPQAIDDDVAWGIIDLMDNLLNQQESEKNEIYS
jgi:hypothetical protein